MPEPGLPNAVPAPPALPAAVPAAPTVEAPAAPTVPDAVPTPSELGDLGEQIVTAVQEEGGNINVSVRVLSPGENEPVSQETAPTQVISDEQKPDTTPSSETDRAADPAAGHSDSVGETEHGSADDIAGNTNVTVRVLSPGENGPVTQTNGQSSDPAAALPTSAPKGTTPIGAEPPSEPSPDAAPGAGDSTDEASLFDEDSARYHEGDSQYQSDVPAEKGQWYWSWQLVIDCSGDVTSLSTETGSSSSADWAWDWQWDWSCEPQGEPQGQPSTSPDARNGNADSTGAALVPSPATTSSSSSPTNTNVSVRVLSPGDDGPVTQTNASADATDASVSTSSPWRWNWTFTFCSRTVSFSTELDVQADFDWLWSWAWNWACDAAVGPPPDLAGATEPAAGAAQEPEDRTTAPEPGTVAQSSPEPPAAIPAAPAAVGVFEAPAPQADPSQSWPTLSVLTLPLPTVEVAVAVAVAPQIPLAALTELSPPTFDAALEAAGVRVSVVVVPAQTSRVLLPDGTQTTAVPAPEAAQAPRNTATPPPPRATTWTSPPSSTKAAALALAEEQAERSSARSSEHEPKKPVSVRPAPRQPRERGPLFPFGELQSTQTSGSGAFGGRVPSGQVVGAATTLAFFMLAAPALGRRIGVARELSPRSAYRSSIDHPG